jgi:HlyD family secretion protein
MRLRRYFTINGAAVLVILGCGSGPDKNFLGSAVVEMQTFQVATTVSGTILAVYREEGQKIAAGELLAVVDTLPLTLQVQELNSSRAELKATVAGNQAQAQAMAEEVKGLEREYKRIGDLADKGTVPAQQKDNLETQYHASQSKLLASQQMLAAFQEKERGLSVKMEQLRNQLNKCMVRAPAGGVILTRFKNTGEIVLPGNPIFETGRSDSVQVDFFVPQPLVSGLTLGQAVRIRLDAVNSSTGAKESWAPAVISWVSDEAEFSPKNIQTRESRTELVFKVRAVAGNVDGRLKRGLPVEIWR